MVVEEVSIADSNAIGGVLDRFTDRIVEIGFNPFKGF